MRSDTVLRHPLVVRLTHWIVAASGLGLVFTGIAELPMYKRYGLTTLPGLTWSGDFILNLKLHYPLAAIFGAAVFFHMVFHLRRGETAAVPKTGDAAESVRIIAAMLKGEKEPPHGKFLAEQRLAYAAIGVVSLGLIVTGLVKSWKNLGAITLDPSLLQAVTLIHTGFTMIFLFLVIAHVAAFLLKANRPLLPSMLTGRVRREYARERHPLWKPED